MSGSKVWMAALTSSTLFFDTWAVPTSTIRSETRSIKGARPGSLGPKRPRRARPPSARFPHVDRAVADELEDDFEVLGRLLVDREDERHDIAHAQRVDEVVGELRERLLVVVHGQRV